MFLSIWLPKPYLQDCQDMQIVMAIAWVWFVAETARAIKWEILETSARYAREDRGQLSVSLRSDRLRHTCRQNTNTHKIKISKLFFKISSSSSESLASLVLCKIPINCKHKIKTTHKQCVWWFFVFLFYMNGNMLHTLFCAFKNKLGGGSPCL